MSGRVFAIVTGASRGFGKSVAEELVRNLAPQHAVDMILIARSESGLAGTAQAIEEITRGLASAHKVNVRREVLDLGNLGSLEQRLGDIFAIADPRCYSRAVLINNAGSFVNVGPANELTSLESLRAEMDLNVTSTLWITSSFAGVFGARRPRNASESGHLGEEGEGASSPPCARNVVVNVSSLCAVEPVEFCSTYSAGKAARDMFHRVLALEQQALGGLKVLNYAPGPMDTELVRQMRRNALLRDAFTSFVDVQASAQKCVRLALAEDCQTGAHVDFFDDESVPAGCDQPK